MEIEFIKANMIADVSMEFPAVRNRNIPFYYMTAPQIEEERALKIAQMLDEATVGEKTFLACNNNFHWLPVPAENTAEEKLSAAVYRGETDKVQTLTAQNVNLTNPDRNGDTVLHLAVRQGCVENIKTLIGAKADLNAKNEKSETPLLVAARFGDTETVRLLVAAGADVHARDKYNSNAAFHALSSPDGSMFRKIEPTDDERITILKILKDAGLNFAAKGSYSNLTLLTHYFERRGGSENVVKTLLDFGAETNPVGDGYTALMKAVNLLSSETNRNEIVKLLLSRGADINRKDGRGWSALTYAKKVEEGNLKSQNLHKETIYDAETIRLLIEAGAKE